MLVAGHQPSLITQMTPYLIWKDTRGVATGNPREARQDNGNKLTWPLWKWNTSHVRDTVCAPSARRSMRLRTHAGINQSTCFLGSVSTQHFLHSLDPSQPQTDDDGLLA